MHGSRKEVSVEHKRLSVSNIANFRVGVSSTLKLVKQLTFKTLRSTQAVNEALHSGSIDSNLKPDRAWAYNSLGQQQTETMVSRTRGTRIKLVVR